LSIPPNEKLRPRKVETLTSGKALPAERVFVNFPVFHDHDEVFFRIRDKAVRPDGVLFCLHDGFYAEHEYLPIRKILKPPAASCRKSSIVRYSACFLNRSLTLPQAAENALATTVQRRSH
jgi:hypothetical protein